MDRYKKEYLSETALHIWLREKILKSRLEASVFDEILRSYAVGVTSYSINFRWDVMEVFVYALSIGAAQDFRAFEEKLVGAIEHLGFQFEGWPVTSNVYRFKPLYTLEEIQSFLTDEVFPYLEKGLEEDSHDDLVADLQDEEDDYSEEE